MQSAPVAPNPDTRGAPAPFVVVLDPAGRVVHCPRALAPAAAGDGPPPVAVTPVSAWTACLEGTGPVEAVLEIGAPVAARALACTLVALRDGAGRPAGVAAIPAPGAVGGAGEAELWQRVLRVTHDLANQLFVLSGNLELLEIAAAGHPELLELVQRASPAADRARTLAREAHDVARHGRGAA